MKVCTVIGTRPEAIKMALLVKILRDMPGIEHRLCITAQHREMLDSVLTFFNISADRDLNIMQPGQQLAGITTSVLQKVSHYFLEWRPDLVLVHGDTNSCFAAALAAFYMQIPVAHVEAGLRTYDMQAPFPEEANRVLTSRIATYHFAPTGANAENLVREGVPVGNICVTGNTVIDAVLYTAENVRSLSGEASGQGVGDIVNNGEQYILVTGHRRENFGRGLQNICSALRHLAEMHPHLYFIYPVHLNPQVSGPVHTLLGQATNIILTKPLTYPDFIFLMQHAWAVLTDSGGIQEEAPALHKPVLVMREVTERPEALAAGTVALTGSSEASIIKTVNALLDNAKMYRHMADAKNPYGDGKASVRIADFIRQSIAGKQTRKPLAG